MRFNADSDVAGHVNDNIRRLWHGYAVLELGMT
jgi:hypothetical protein